MRRGYILQVHVTNLTNYSKGGTADNVHRKYTFRKEEEHEKVQ